MALIPSLPGAISWSNLPALATAAGFDTSLGGIYRAVRDTYRSGAASQYVPSDVSAAFGNMLYDATGIGERRTTERMRTLGQYYANNTLHNITGSMPMLIQGTPSITFDSLPAAPLSDPGLAYRSFSRGPLPRPVFDRMYSRRSGFRSSQRRWYTYGHPRIPRHFGPRAKSAPRFRRRFIRVQWRRPRRPGLPIRIRRFVRKPGF